MKASRKPLKRAAKGPRRDVEAEVRGKGKKTTSTPSNTDGKMQVKVTCRGADTTLLGDLTPFQGDLKHLSEENYEKLKAAVVKYGFSFPMAVWKNDGRKFCIDGHQRDKVLKRMEQEGYEIPPLPIDYVDAKDEREAKEKILLATSQYGEMNNYSLTGFLEESDLKFLDFTGLINLPQINVDFFRDPNFEPGNENEQGRLDQKKSVTCPECGAEFVPK